MWIRNLSYCLFLYECCVKTGSHWSSKTIKKDLKSLFWIAGQNCLNDVDAKRINDHFVVWTDGKNYVAYVALVTFPKYLMFMLTSAKRKKAMIIILKEGAEFLIILVSSAINRKLISKSKSTRAKFYADDVELFISCAVVCLRGSLSAKISNISRKMLSDTSGTISAATISFPGVFKPLIPPFPMSLCFPQTHISPRWENATALVFPEILLYDIKMEEWRRETRRATSLLLLFLFFAVWSMCTVYVEGAINPPLTLMKSL